jgi:hypothetical protein
MCITVPQLTLFIIIVVHFAILLEMVLLTATQAAKAAIEDYLALHADDQEDDPLRQRLERLEKISLDGPVEHADLIAISKAAREDKNAIKTSSPRQCRLETLLKGATVYQPPPPPKPEPVSNHSHTQRCMMLTPTKSAQYKALMQRLRKQEEQREYERMINPPPEKETFGQRFPHSTFNPNTYHGQTGVDEAEGDVTYQDVDRQVALIINVLVSIIACAVALWIVARHWAVPQRLALAMGGSLTVAAAEVAIYFGYIRRLEEAKGKEVKLVEQKEVSEMWVIEKASGSAKNAADDALRYRKGRHR